MGEEQRIGGRRIGLIAVLLIGLLLAAAMVLGKDRLREAPPSPPDLPLDPKTAFRKSQERFPKPGACERIEIGDPAREAAANIRKGDLRPFTVFGFTRGDAPGILCPSGDYHALVSRGGTFVSDMPDACGGHSFSTSDPAKMLAYNEALASSREFQAATGCRRATYCETRYSKHGMASGTKIDPLCPNEPAIFTSIAASGSAAELREALRSYTLVGDARRDLLTVALVSAIMRAKWENVKILVAAGADVNGAIRLPESRTRYRLDPPLAAIFNQNDDRERQIEMARWLMARGASVKKSNAHIALTWAASSNDVEAVTFLLSAGASPNGGIEEGELDQLAKGDIRSAGGGYGYGMTPFYAAIEQAVLSRFDGTPKDKAWADAERRKAELNAVRLYRAGGRFIVGKVYDRLHEYPNTHVASILLAAAHREGRLRELGERMLEPFARSSPTTPEKIALKRYLDAVLSCETIRPKPMTDHIKLCASGEV